MTRLAFEILYYFLFLIHKYNFLSSKKNKKNGSKAFMVSRCFSLPLSPIQNLTKLGLYIYNQSVMHDQHIYCNCLKILFIFGSCYASTLVAKTQDISIQRVVLYIVLLVQPIIFYCSLKLRLAMQKHIKTMALMQLWKTKIERNFKI